VDDFRFLLLRFHFRALDAVRFPALKSGNTIRGAFGAALKTVASAEQWRVGFSPRGALAPPRPFILRTSHLDDATFHPGDAFHFDLHLFDLRTPWLAVLKEAFAVMAARGIGIGRGRAELASVDESECVISLEPAATPIDRLTLHFVTPTELKSANEIAAQPEFSILFARIRDRLDALRTAYGDGPLDIDFLALGERAGSIRMVRCVIEWEHIQRRSSRTGQVHPIGGLTGEVEYAGELAEFLPWLRAAHWIGVGRHTGWGNGDVRVVGLP
jgi:hypothetical protein